MTPTRLAQFRNNGPLLPSNNKRQNLQYHPLLVLRFFYVHQNKTVLYIHCSRVVNLPQNNNTFVFNTKGIYKEKHYNCSYFIYNIELLNVIFSNYKHFYHCARAALCSYIIHTYIYY